MLPLAFNIGFRITRVRHFVMRYIPYRNGLIIYNQLQRQIIIFLT